MDTRDNVYLGVWTNFARGGSAIMGATLTTTREQGGFLIAFTALFIPYVMSRLWRIFCLVSHHYHSTPCPKDPIHHQRQIIYRNSSSADSGMFYFLLVLFAWRRLSWKRLACVAPAALFALTFVVIATLAGGYSSQISAIAGDEVLLKGNHCSILNWGVEGDPKLTDIMALNTREAERIVAAANYAQQCYSTSGGGLLGCERFIAQNIPTVVKDYGAACPFSSNVCKDNHTNVRLDTGYVDSTLHFGLNAPENERFSWRHVLTCAPLRTDGYTGTVDMLNKSFPTYNYGNTYNGNSDQQSILNFTYMVSDLDSQYSQSGKTPFGLSYRLYAIAAIAEDGKFKYGYSNFLPIQDISEPNGNVVLVFLSGNGIRFLKAYDDGWYMTTTPDQDLSMPIASDTIQGYKFDEPASPLGCVQQWQWCNSTNPRESDCGPLASSLDAISGALPLFNLTENHTVMENQQRAKLHTTTGAHFLWSVLMQNSRLDGILNVISYLGMGSLASQSSLSGGIQLDLHENQWQLDVTNWWNIMLSMYQSAFVETAIGESAPELQSTVLVPSNDYEREACRSQKIRSTVYASFSLFGLLFTYIVGVLFIVISFILDPVLRCLHRRKKYKQYQYLEWCTNDMMQLHRLAHSPESGTECWTRCTDSIPVTKSDVLLAGLDISDPKAPKIRRGTQPEEKRLELKDSQQRPLKGLELTTKVMTVSSEGSLQSPCLVRNTSPEENNSGVRNGHDSHPKNTKQKAGDLGDW